VVATVGIVFMRHQGEIWSIETDRLLRHPAHPCNTLPPGRDTEANALSTCGSLAKEFPHERIHVDGFEWAIMDSR
jgi:hypothetical protein